MVNSLQADKEAIIELHEDYDYYSEAFLRILDRNMQVVPFVWNLAQRHFWANKRGNYHAILKSRKEGFSTWIQGYIHQQVTTETHSAITLADNDKHTTNMRNIYNRFYNQWPEEYIEHRRERDKDSKITISYPDTESESSIATAGSATAGRSGTYSKLHASEIAFWRNDTIVLTGLLQSLTDDAEVFLESTPNGAQGEFFQICMQALDGKGKFQLHFYPWWWGAHRQLPLEPGETIILTDAEKEVVAKAASNGFTISPEQINWRRAKIAEPGMGLRFPQEYPEDIRACFLTSGASVFGLFEEYLRDHNQTEPVKDHRHIGGLDWGQTEDYTVLCIIDADTGQEVFLDRWRRQDEHTVIRQILNACQKWNVSLLRPEKNSFGRTNISILRSEIYKAELEIAVSPFTTTNESKRLMADRMKWAIYNERLFLMKTDYEWATSEMRTFVQTQTPDGRYKYDHMKSAKSDSVIARMAAWDGMFKISHEE